MGIENRDGTVDYIVYLLSGRMPKPSDWESIREGAAPKKPDETHFVPLHDYLFPQEMDGSAASPDDLKSAIRKELTVYHRSKSLSNRIDKKTRETIEERIEDIAGEEIRTAARKEVNR